MGGASSKQDAFLGTHGNDERSDETPCSCFQLFCPPNNDNKSKFRLRSFGTPLPDTPEKVRRIRNGHSDESKSSSANGNNNGYSGTNHDELRSSKYCGLEREFSGMFVNDSVVGVGDLEESQAEIHDGKVSVYSVFHFIIVYLIVMKFSQ